MIPCLQISQSRSTLIEHMLARAYQRKSFTTRQFAPPTPRPCLLPSMAPRLLTHLSPPPQQRHPPRGTRPLPDNPQPSLPARPQQQPFPQWPMPPLRLARQWQPHRPPEPLPPRPTPRTPRRGNSRCPPMRRHRHDTALATLPARPPAR